MICIDKYNDAANHRGVVVFVFADTIGCKAAFCLLYSHSIVAGGFEDMS